MPNATENFFELTPERILTAVEQIGLRCTGRCLALNSMENRVYEVEIVLKEEPDSRYDAFRVVKFYRPGRWSEEQILEEHRFLAELAEDDLPVVAPLPFPDGSTLKKIEELGILFCVFPKVGGRNLDEPSREQLEILGRLLARLHVVGACSQAPSRMELTPQTYGRANLEYLLGSNCLLPNFRSRYQDIVERLLSICEPWFAGVPSQRLHGDCHLGNMLWRQDGPLLVDFDDMLRGPCVQDLWLMVPGRDEDALARREVMVAAYEQMRRFDRETLRLIEPLRALRIIHFSAWIARRWEDPSFKRVFVDFGGERYWSEQIVALDECLNMLYGAGA